MLKKLFFGILLFAISIGITIPVFAQESEVSIDDQIDVDDTDNPTGIEISLSDGVGVSGGPESETPGEELSVMHSPKKQTAMGVSADDIQCKEDLTLIKKYDGTPACVKESSVEKLIARGWAA